jgi:hypothetical protein
LLGIADVTKRPGFGIANSELMNGLDMDTNRHLPQSSFRRCWPWPRPGKCNGRDFLQAMVIAQENVHGSAEAYRP